MSLDLNKLDEKVTDVLNQMTDEDWKAYKNKMVISNFDNATTITKKIEVVYYKHGDFEWSLVDIYRALDENNREGIYGELQVYLEDNKILSVWSEGVEENVNYEFFYNKIWSLMYLNETKMPYDINTK